MKKPEEELVTQLAAVLGIETDMGLEYLKQALRNALLFERKQKDYGSGNISVFGAKGVIVRASDKVQRLKHLVFDRGPVSGDGVPEAPLNESVADSWDDLANYGVIGRLCVDGKWK